MQKVTITNVSQDRWEQFCGRIEGSLRPSGETLCQSDSARSIVGNSLIVVFAEGSSYQGRFSFVKKGDSVEVKGAYNLEGAYRWMARAMEDPSTQEPSWVRSVLVAGVALTPFAAKALYEGVVQSVEYGELHSDNCRVWPRSIPLEEALLVKNSFRQ